MMYAWACSPGKRVGKLALCYEVIDRVLVVGYVDVLAHIDGLHILLVDRRRRSAKQR